MWLSCPSAAAEILGAVTSVLTIWVVTAVLVYMAVERMSHGHYDIDADTMLIVSGIGVAVNIVYVSAAPVTGARRPLVSHAKPRNVVA